MRYVLYVFTWFVAAQTLGDLFQGDFGEFATGLFLTGLFVWWSLSVRNRRRKKLGLTNSAPGLTRGGKAGRAVQAFKSEWQNSQSNTKGETRQHKSAETAGTDLAEKAAEIAPDKSSDDTKMSTVEIATESSKSPNDEPSLTSLEEKRPSTMEAQAPQESAKESAEEVSRREPLRPDWKDAAGRSLHIGANVSFLANSRGKSVSIPGVLIGERDGKALIEVSSGSLLPKNDYSIPWNVVSLAD